MRILAGTSRLVLGTLWIRAKVALPVSVILTSRPPELQHTFWRFGGRVVTGLARLQMDFRWVSAHGLISLGVARVDVTPEGPIRLHGYGSRKTESTGVAQKLWAKALAIGDDPLLVVTDSDGQLRAVLVNYACHATTVKSYGVHGDWPGSAQLAIEAKHPGVVAMISIGCGADAGCHSTPVTVISVLVS